MKSTDLSRSSNPDAAPILDEACAKFTALPSLTLARRLYCDHPGLWPNVNACRMAIQLRRGRRGTVCRTTKFACTAPSEPLNPWILPKSEAEPWKPLKVTVDKDTSTLIASDFQFPYYDRPATLCMLDRAKREEVGIIIINGDLLDFYQLSKFNKDPRRFRPSQEIKMASQFLDAIDANFPHARKIFKLGNHDERLDHYLWMLAAQQPAMADIIEKLFHRFLESKHGLNLDARGWETVRDRQIIMLGRLPVLHGHEFPYTGDSVNPARTLFLKTISNGIMGDRHRTSEHVERNLGDKVISCWSIGCLCGLHPYWMPVNKWNHGFAIVEIDRAGSYSVTNIRVYNGKAFN
jgi:predicted phosphodiesterase